MSDDETEGGEVALEIIPISNPRIDISIDPQRRMFVGVDLQRSPMLKVSMVAVLFFRSASWLRRSLRMGHFAVPTEPLRLTGKATNRPLSDVRDENGVRLFSLADVEVMAHNAYSNGAISHAHFVSVIVALHGLGLGYGVLDS